MKCAYRMCQKPATHFDRCAEHEEHRFRLLDVNGFADAMRRQYGWDGKTPPMQATAPDDLCTDCDCTHQCAEQSAQIETLQRALERAKGDLAAAVTARNLAQDMAKELLDTLASGRF